MQLLKKKPQKLKYKKKLKLKKKLLIEKNKSFYTELVKINAYYGDTHLRSHYTQDSFVYAYRNDYAIYNIHNGILNFKRALGFIQKQRSKSFIFVGSPKDSQEKCEFLFNKLEIPFFPSNEWVPGFISKKSCNHPKILVLYDIFTNIDAKSEAFKANFPIVGFFTTFGDVSGIDFPVNLNIEHCGSWYYSLWKSFFNKKDSTKENFIKKDSIKKNLTKKIFNKNDSTKKNSTKKDFNKKNF